MEKPVWYPGTQHHLPVGDTAEYGWQLLVASPWELCDTGLAMSFLWRCSVTYVRAHVLSHLSLLSSLIQTFKNQGQLLEMQVSQ